MGEGGSSNAIDISSATSGLTQLGDAVSSYWEAAQPIVLSVIGIALVATLLWVGYKLIRKGANKVG